MVKYPAQVSSLLNDLIVNLPDIFGNNFVGIYLYGSLTQRAFDLKRSDIDCIIVTNQELSERQFINLDGWLEKAARSNPWYLKLQATFLIRDKVLTVNSPGCLYQFGRLTRPGSDGNPIIWMNVLKSGITLIGPRPQTFFPAITPEILHRALVREVGYIREEIVANPTSEWRDVPYYRAYAVLTLCRILYSFRHGTVVSKPRAARWAIKHLPVEWEGLIRQALCYDADLHPVSICLSQIVKLLNLVAAQIISIPPHHPATQRNDAIGDMVFGLMD
jgi:hypothetical protein